MTAARQPDLQYRLQMHQFAVQLYETTVERYGIHHEQAQLARWLVEATDSDQATPRTPERGTA